MNTEMPRYIELETSRYCNRACCWCPNSVFAERRTQELMRWDLFNKIVADLGSLTFAGWLALHNYNEPLANPRIIDELRVVRTLVPQAKPSIFTNGDFLDICVAESLAQCGVAYLRVTLYPGRAGDTTPSEMHIRRYLAARNFDGIGTWDLHAVRQGVACVTHLREMQIEIIRPNIHSYNYRGGMTQLDLASNRISPCAMTTHSAAIDYLGRFKMCCNVFLGSPKHQEYALGDLQTSGFLDLWSSPRMQQLRASHLKADWSSSPICANCSHELPPYEAGTAQPQYGEVR